MSIQPTKDLSTPPEHFRAMPKENGGDVDSTVDATSSAAMRVLSPKAQGEERQGSDNYRPVSLAATIANASDSVVHGADPSSKFLHSRVDFEYVPFVFSSRANNILPPGKNANDRRSNLVHWRSYFNDRKLDRIENHTPFKDP